MRICMACHHNVIVITLQHSLIKTDEGTGLSVQLTCGLGKERRTDGSHSS